MADPRDSAELRRNRANDSRQRRSARQMAAERQSRDRLTKVIAGIIVILVIAAIVGFFLLRGMRGAGAVPAGTTDYSYVGAQHSNDPVTYAEKPPVGGVHNPVWQNCGYYASPVINEHAVHSLEHGAVWITYQPDLPVEQVTKLRNLAEGQSYILVSPYAGIPAPVVASAWNHQILLDSADDPRLDQFIRAFRLSPQAPEPGAACAGGTSVMQ
ncbi:MAG: DUF3105 domain-containing protein [Thermomicrobiales bacterium]|nr:DUF3105 domain-containing protein [Thermomicrobiales bacterium]